MTWNELWIDIECFCIWRESALIEYVTAACFIHFLSQYLQLPGSIYAYLEQGYVLNHIILFIFHAGLAVVEWLKTVFDFFSDKAP